MYNRYIPQGSSYVRVQEEDGAPFTPPRQDQEENASAHGGSSAHAGRTQSHQGQGGGRQNQPPLFDLGALFGGGGKKEHAGGLTDMLKALNLGNLDTGDILLMLILLFLFLEGDNTELVITLALMLLLGLGDKKSEENSGD